MTRARRYDVVVIGAGTAGLVAGIRLAQAGARVCVVARGYGSTHLAPGSVDVLGYLPGVGGLGAAAAAPNPPTPGATPGATPGPTSTRTRVEHPAGALTQLLATHPDHPYARLGPRLLDDALTWFLHETADALPAYRYAGGLERNLLLPTAVGALKPSAAAPETFVAGDAAQLGRVVIVGIGGLRDFHAQLCAANLRAAGIDAHAIDVAVRLDHADASTLTLARHFDDPLWLGRFSSLLAPLLGPSDQVGLPALLGVRDPHAALVALRERLGCAVFEIPTLPPSVPGLRLFEILRARLRAAGGQLALGAGVVAHTRTGDRVTAVQTESAGSPTRYAADAFVLAAGGVHSGQVTLDSRWQTHERVLELPLAGVPADGEPRFSGAYFDEQPLARIGVAVDERLRAVGVSNVAVAGAALPGAVPWLEGSGEGIALASGYHAAQLLSGARRAHPSRAATEPLEEARA